MTESSTNGAFLKSKGKVTKGCSGNFRPCQKDCRDKVLGLIVLHVRPLRDRVGGEFSVGELVFKHTCDGDGRADSTVPSV